MKIEFEKLEQLLRDWKNIGVEWQHVIDLSRTIKNKAQIVNDEKSANLAWFYEEGARVHSLYLRAFADLKNRKYYQAWVILERIEIALIFINQNFFQETNDYGLIFLKDMVANYQAIYPYKVFFSSRYKLGSKTCSICNKKVTFTNNCGHRKGKLYSGELCLHALHIKDIITFDVVRHPVNKFAVAFKENEFIAGLQDHYDYTRLVLALAGLRTPYEEWSIDIKTNYLPHNSSYSPNDVCPCFDSLKTYKECCLNKPGVEYKHIFIDYYISPEETEKRLKLAYPIYPFSGYSPFPVEFFA